MILVNYDIRVVRLKVEFVEELKLCDMCCIDFQDFLEKLIVYKIFGDRG